MWEYVILFKKIFTSITYYHFIITARILLVIKSKVS